MLKEQQSCTNAHVVTHCLNPYFNGTCSKSFIDSLFVQLVLDSLNPYFNGTCSKRNGKDKDESHHSMVLILILMEHAQREHFL